MRTFPVGSRTALWLARFTDIDPVVNEKVPVAGSYSSAVLVWLVPDVDVWPPTTRTLPFANSVAVWFCGGVDMPPVGPKAPAAGSYSCAEALEDPPSKPPTTKTLPFDRRVAVCRTRAVPIFPVAVNVPAAGSYSSAEE